MKDENFRDFIKGNKDIGEFFDEVEARRELEKRGFIVEENTRFTIRHESDEEFEFKTNNLKEIINKLRWGK